MKQDSPAAKRLDLLPEVFTFNDLTNDTYLGDAAMTSEAAKKFLIRARDRGLVARAAEDNGRASVYYNLRRDIDGPINRPMEAAHLLYEEALVIGLSVLHTYGWITQIPKIVDIAIHSTRRSCPKIRGVNFYFRPLEWFRNQKKSGAILDHRESEFVLPSLTPRAALDDINLYRDMWVPAKDDLFMPANEEEGVRREVPKRSAERNR